MLEIIAEAAQGYLGDPKKKTLDLVDFASAAKADAIKFQLVYSDELCTNDYIHHELFTRLEMGNAEWHSVASKCMEKGIHLYLDIFGIKSLRLACELSVKGIKLHSTDILNKPLLQAVAASSVPRVILSAGGTFLSELKEAVSILGNKELIIMHGFQGYPTMSADNQLDRIRVFQKDFPERNIGFADHVPEDDDKRCWFSAIAIGMGVTVLEKHITSATVCKDEDHESALNPDNFAQYCKNMRIACSAIGSSVNSNDFGMSQSEYEYRRKMKKHVIARRDLAAGELISETDLELKRTSAMGNVVQDSEKIIGQRLRNSKLKNQAFFIEDIE